MNPFCLKRLGYALGLSAGAAIFGACGAAPEKPDEPKVSKPAVAAAAQNATPAATATELFCKYSTPRSGSWEVERGYAQGPKAQAIENARKAARENLIKHLKQSYAARLVDRVASKIDTSYYEPQYDPASQTACVFAFLDSKAILAADQSSADYSKALTEALKPLKDSVARQLKQKPLCIDTPSSDVGGNAGEVGPKLRTRLLSLFEGQKLVSKDCWRLGGVVSSELERCKYVPVLRSQGEMVPLAAVDFHPLALGLKSCQTTAASALRDGDMGLESGGYHQGSTGLTVSINLSNADSMMELCAGESFEMSVETNQPALVRFYSVAADGRVMLDYEMNVMYSATLPPLIAVQLEPNLKYRMVAVAVPLGESFGRFEPSMTAEQSGACLGRGGLKRSQFPETAAWAAVDHSVRAPGSGGCPNDPQTLNIHEQILSYVRNMPTCSR